MLMNMPNVVPPEKRDVLHRAVDELIAVEGVVAVVLGGSYARGTHHERSDLDVGVYYSEVSPFSIEAVRRVAERLDIDGRPAVTDFFGWGPWVNGGAWIRTSAGKLDLIYRNVEHVERIIRESEDGTWRHDYGQQPTFGFHSVIYLAETQACVPLWDPGNVIARLKHAVREYPPKLRQRIVSDSLWSAEFALWFARRYALAGDVYNTTGCLARIAGYMTQTLYALNAVYFITDKGVMDAVARFQSLPPAYVERITRVLACPGGTSVELVQTVDALQTLWREAVSLAGEMYRPGFSLENLDNA